MHAVAAGFGATFGIALALVVLACVVLILFIFVCILNGK